MQPSPYTPGQVADVLFGREPQVRRLRERIQRVATDGTFDSRPRVFIGGPGVGKTSLLRHSQNIAQDQGLSTVWVTGGRTCVVTGLIRELTRFTRSWPVDEQEEFGHLVGDLKKALKATRIGGWMPDEDRQRIKDAPGEALARLLGTTIRSGQQRGSRGLVVLFDDLNRVDETGVRAVVHAWQHLARWRDPDVPALLLATGASTTRDVMGYRESFPERFEFPRLKPLGSQALRDALVDPVEALGVSWDDDALRVVMDRARGHLPFVQLYGDGVWEAAGRPDPGESITLADVTAADPSITAQIEASFRKGLWEATATEREVLRAVASRGGDPATSLTIINSVSGHGWSLKVEASLMNKKLLHSPDPDLFTLVPGFADYILSH